MNEDNSQRRFRPNQLPKQQLYSDYGSKDARFEKNHLHADFDQDTRRHIDDMKQGGNKILVNINPSSYLLSHRLRRSLSVSDHSMSKNTPSVTSKLSKFSRIKSSCYWILKMNSNLKT